MRLIDVYKTADAADVLYALLKERIASINISHRSMPSLREHKSFMKSRPYKAWFLIKDGREYVGSIYLSNHENEIGVFIFRSHQRQGFGTKAVKMLVSKHRLKKWDGNVNPRNKSAIAFLRSLGGKHVQNTYETRL